SIPRLFQHLRNTLTVPYTLHVMAGDVSQRPLYFSNNPAYLSLYSFPTRRSSDLILEVATRLFARQGYQGTTTKQISDHARVNEALVFRHFPSKEELYWAVIERKINSACPRERLRENLEIGGDDLVIFARLGAEILERRANDQTLSRLLLFSALENHRLSHRFFRTYVAEYYDMLADFIRKRIAEGRFRDVDPLL